MFGDIRGVITFGAFSDEPEKFINDLRNSQITITNLKVSDGYITGDAYARDYPLIERAAAKNSLSLIEEKRRGIIFTAGKYKYRFGIAIGAVLAFVMVFFLSNTALVIEIYGNETVPDDRIVSALGEYGIYAGKFIPSLDFRLIEKQVITAVDDIAWIGIRNSGSRILVEITEKTSPPEMAERSTPCNIISKKDAQIVEIKGVRMGMLIPMLYDGVAEGDLLISGVITTNTGYTYYVHADGEIIGQYNEKVTFSQKFSNDISVFKNEKKRNSLKIFGLRIPLYLNTKIDGSYEYDETLNNFNLLKMELPIGIVHSRYRLYGTAHVDYDRGQVENILRNKIDLYEKNFLTDESSEILKKEIHYSEKENEMTATVYYTLRGNICQTVEIMN